MPPGVLDCRVAVDVGEQAEAESVAVVGGICEAIDKHAGGGSLKRLPDTIVELVVNNRAPVPRLLVGHALPICTGNALTGQRNEPRTRSEQKQSPFRADKLLMLNHFVHLYY